MRNGKYDVLSPLYSGEPVNEAEVLGAAVWLWMHSPLHRDAPLHTLPDLLLPVIKHRQYVVATEQGRPVFFMSQAWLSPEAEARYLTQPAILMPQSDWNSGDANGAATGKAGVLNNHSATIEAAGYCQWYVSVVRPEQTRQ